MAGKFRQFIEDVKSILPAACEPIQHAFLANKLRMLVYGCGPFGESVWLRDRFGRLI
jgi:hypothetical protein